MTTKTISLPTTDTAAPAALTRRPRRLRRTEGIRSLVRETMVRPEDLIYPLFVVPNERPRVEIKSMPGVYQNRVREAVDDARRAFEAGVRAVLLFGIPEYKDGIGSASWDPSGPVQSATEAIKRAIPEMTVMADVCMCEYTDHGHCGVLSDEPGGGDVLNDPTLDLLARAAVAYANAGADVLAPSAMMDGQVAAIRAGLDAAGHAQAPILAYAAKFASAFYGPFREAAESTPAFGDRRSHQMDPANVEEALREVRLDIEEGADIVMVKPAITYLDVISRVKQEFGMPTAAYHVSGEYAMLKAAAWNGWIDEPRAMMETLTSIRRAGADIIITYYAREAARALA